MAKIPCIITMGNGGTGVYEYVHDGKLHVDAQDKPSFWKKLRKVYQDRGYTRIEIWSSARNDASMIWADPETTAERYPMTGKSPAPVRQGCPGNVIASSAVRCPWDCTRYRMIDYA